MAKVALIVDGVKKCVGRLVGIIGEEECQALVNSKGAPKKAYTSRTIPLDEITVCNQKRFVLALPDRKIYISPLIRYVHKWSLESQFVCYDSKTYTLKSEEYL